MPKACTLLAETGQGGAPMIRVILKRLARALLAIAIGLGLFAIDGVWVSHQFPALTNVNEVHVGA